MRLAEKIFSEKETILESWFNMLLSAFPESSLQYLRKKSNQFTNPLGYNLFISLQTLLNSFLANDYESENFIKSLEEVIKLRSTQELSHFERANIYKQLKLILINKFANSIDKKDLIELFEYFLKFEEAAFNKYIEIQNLKFEIQKEEIRNRYGKILDRINQRYEKQILNKQSK